MIWAIMSEDKLDNTEAAILGGIRGAVKRHRRSRQIMLVVTAPAISKPA